MYLFSIFALYYSFLVAYLLSLPCLFLPDTFATLLHQFTLIALCPSKSPSFNSLPSVCLFSSCLPSLSSGGPVVGVGALVEMQRDL